MPKIEEEKKTHSPPMTFKDPADFGFFESASSLSGKLKRLLSTSMQEPWKPGFSYTTACDTDEHMVIWPEEQVAQPG